MSTNNNNLKVTSAILAATLGSASLCACSTTGDTNISLSTSDNKISPEAF